MDPEAPGCWRVEHLRRRVLAFWAKSQTIWSATVTSSALRSRAERISFRFRILGARSSKMLFFLWRGGSTMPPTFPAPAAVSLSARRN